MKASTSNPPINKTSKETPLVFISYSHKDEAWKDRLRPHLAVLERQGRISIWDDRQIDAGAQWHPAIIDVMKRCKVAICLISADYLASEFCTGKELPELMDRREHDNLVIIPVLLRPCDWQDYPWLEELQMLPRDGKSVANDYAAQWDKVFARVANRVRKAVGSSSPIHKISDHFRQKSTWGALALTAALTAATIIVISTFGPLKKEVKITPEVLNLLETAEMHELIGRLCSPPGSNAAEVYRMVLDITPADPTAKDALARLDCP